MGIIINTKTSKYFIVKYSQYYGTSKTAVMVDAELT